MKPTKGEATAERILEAASRSIAARGCGAVTLRGIADEAGVALSQLNYYYGNKDRLFTAVLERMQRQYLDALGKWLGVRRPLAEQISALVDYHASILNNDPDIYRNFLEFFNFAMTSESFHKKVANFTLVNSNTIEKYLVNKGNTVKAIQDVSMAEVTRYILSASFGIALQHFLSPESRDIYKGFDIVKKTAMQLVDISHDTLPQSGANEISGKACRPFSG